MFSIYQTVQQEQQNSQKNDKQLVNSQQVIQSLDNSVKLYQQRSGNSIQNNQQEKLYSDYIQQKQDTKISPKKNAGLGIRFENQKIDKLEIDQQPQSGKSTLPNILDTRTQVIVDQKGFTSDQITQSAPRFQQNNQNIEAIIKNNNQKKGSISMNNNNKEIKLVISKNSLSSLPEANNHNFDNQLLRQRYGSEGGVGAILNIPKSIFIEKIQTFQSEHDKQLSLNNKEQNIVLKSNENFEINQNISPCFINSPNDKNNQSSLISKKKKKEQSEKQNKTQSNQESEETFSKNENIEINENILCQNDLPTTNNYNNSQIIQLVAPNITIINNDFSQINNFSQQQMQQIMKNENKLAKQKKKKKSFNADGHSEYAVYDTFNTNINSDFSKNNLKKIVTNNKEEINLQNKILSKNGNVKKRNKTNEVKSISLQQKRKKSQKNVSGKELIHHIYSTNYLQNLQYAQIYSNNQSSDKPYMNSHVVKHFLKDDSNKYS